MNIYLVGSLREGRVREVAAALREDRHYVFDDWHAAHPDADDYWRDYELERGRGYREALEGRFAQCVFNFDLSGLRRSDAVVLVARPEKLGGFSAASELTWAKCNGKQTFILLDRCETRDPVRWEFMALLAVHPEDVIYSIDELRRRLAC
jgi:hypothetical protein